MSRAFHLSLGLSLAACGAASDAPPSSSSETRTFTLSTGDRVIVPPSGPLQIRPAPGRERMGFFTARAPGHDLVVPSDLMARAATGELDRAMFEVGDAAPQDDAPAPATVDLHITAVDHLGNPTIGFGVLFGGPRVVELFHPPQTMALVPGEPYEVTFSSLDEPLLLIQPRLLVTGETDLLLDGRLARLPEISLPGRQLDVLGMQAVYIDPGHAQITSSGSDLIRTAQLGPAPAPGEVISYAAIDTVGRDDQAPYVFGHREDDRWMTGFTLVGTPDRVITVRADHRATPDQTFTRFAIGQVPGRGLTTFLPLASTTVQGPFARTEHYIDDGLAWKPVLEQLDADGKVATEQGFVIAPYQPGHHHAELWNRAPFGPALSAIDGVPQARREGDVLTIAPTLFSEVATPSRAGGSRGTQRLALLRDGVVLQEQLDEPFALFEGVEVSAEPATYRFEAEATRPESISELSPSVRAVWTFRSGHTTAREVLALPTLRFTPALDRNNASRAGLPLVLPVHVERLAGAPTPAIQTLTVEASFDDGETWRAVPGARLGSEFLGIVLPPAKAAFLSLRGTASDAAGNRVATTIIRATRLSSAP